MPNQHRRAESRRESHKQKPEPRVLRANLTEDERDQLQLAFEKQARCVTEWQQFDAAMQERYGQAKTQFEMNMKASNAVIVRTFKRLGLPEANLNTEGYQIVGDSTLFAIPQGAEPIPEPAPNPASNPVLELELSENHHGSEHEMVTVD